MKSELHERVFLFCEKYRAENPEFRYWLRTRNENNRLENGLWFQGTDEYASVGLFNRVSGNQSTKSFALLFRNKDGKISGEIEIIFKSEEDPKIIAFYKESMEMIGGFVKHSTTVYRKAFDSENAFLAAKNFLDTYKNALYSKIREKGFEHIFITEESFKEKFERILKYRSQPEQGSGTNINYIIVNITWNSKNWTEPTQEKSTHRYVAEGGIPAESWNFDFDNSRNNNEIIYGFSQFNHPPKVSSENNLIIFSSRKQIVGFYGKAEILDRPYVETMTQNENYNLAGKKALSLCLENKIKNIKEKGYLEDKKRIGQIGFTYLKNHSTVLKMIDEAIELNPSQAEKLNNLKEWVMGNANIENTPPKSPGFKKVQPLNVILYGPPGTGKTYHSVGEAMKIVAPSVYKQFASAEQRQKLREEFTKLLIKDWADTKGQIAFCTFHQSFSYEDFVEGIKPKTSEKQEILYDVENGVFKQICELAESNLSTIKVIKEGKLSWSSEDFQRASYYKISLGDVTNPNDNEIYEYCRDNNCIAIGFGANNDFTGLSESQIDIKCNKLNIRSFDAQQLKNFIHYLKKGNYVIVSYGNKFMRAIGKVTGDYEFIENSPIRYNHFRKVEWLFVDEKIPVEEVYDIPFAQNTIYKIDQNGLKEDFFTGRGQKETLEQREDKKYVLIIDEINRGNIANIFGELITLIENDKRAGNREALEVILPYSKKKFSVPQNLYIIGTMNTADRSIEALDTALRRRFSFREMPPKPELIKTEGVLKETEGKIGELDVVKLLETINKRLEKLIDKDHSIGHSYFMNIKTEAELKLAFKDEVIPLLEEYFFGDFGKIGLVLGSSFIEKIRENTVFASFDYGDAKQDLEDRPVYIIKEPSEWNFASIYQKP